MQDNLRGVGAGAAATHMVIGHTVQSGITSSCKETLWKADVGLSGAFGTNRPMEILEITNSPNSPNSPNIKIIK